MPHHEGTKDTKDTKALLRLRGIVVDRQITIPVKYKGEVLGVVLTRMTLPFTREGGIVCAPTGDIPDRRGYRSG
jgi:hypothetical protein